MRDGRDRTDRVLKPCRGHPLSPEGRGSADIAIIAQTSAKGSVAAKRSGFIEASTISSALDPIDWQMPVGHCC